MSIPGTIQFPALATTPSPPPTGNYVIYTKTDNTLNMEDSLGNVYSFGSTTAISELTGDVSAIGPGSAAATVNFVGGESAANVASATAAYLAATNLNTPSTLVKRDGSGNFLSNIVSLNALKLLGSTSGTITVAAPGTFGSYALTLPTSAGLSSQVLSTDGAGNLSWISALTTTLSSGNIFIGNASNIATPQAPSGDVAMTDAGVFTVVAIQGSSISTTAPTDAQLLIWNSTASKWIPESISGDASINDSGVITIPSTTVTGKLLTGYTTGTNTPITATNSILVAFENLQAQASATSGSAITQLTGDVSATGPGSVAATIESIQGNAVAGTTGTGNVVFSASPTLTGTLNGSSAVFSSTISASNLSGTNTGDVTIVNTNSIDLSFTSGQNNLSANLNLSAASPDVGYIPALSEIKSDGLLVEVLAGLPVQIGTSNNIGSAASASRSDHVHAITSPIVLGLSLTGYTTGTNTPINASDTLLQGFENLQAQVSASVGAAITSLTGDVTATGPGAAAATVVAIQGNSVSTTAPTDAQLLLWVSGTSKWTPASISGDINWTDTGVTTIQSNVVTNSKLAQVPTDTLKGNNTGVTANVTDLTVSQVNTMLGTVTVIGTYDGNGSVANGLSISGNDLYAQSATTSNPGMVNTTTQSFAGNKTFTGTVAITSSSTSALTIDTSAFIFDSINDVLGIGLQPSTSVMIDGINTTGASKLVQMTGYGTGSTTGYRGRFANGTLVSPTAATAGNILNALSGRGYGASQFPAASTGAINIVAGETFTNASNATDLQFETTPAGSVTVAESMRVASTGVTLGPQSSSTAVHQINGGLSGTTNTIASTTYAVDSVTTDYILYTNSTSNAITVTLPAPTNGRILIIEDKAGTAQTNNITVDPHASETINGKSSFVISQNYGSIRITSDGTNWFIQALPPNIASTITPVIALTESGGTTTINWATGNVFTLTLNANLTVTFSNQTAGQTLIVRLTNTASNYTVTWPTIRWPAATAPTMSTGAVSDVYTFIYDGSNYYGSYVQNMS